MLFFGIFLMTFDAILMSIPTCFFSSPTANYMFAGGETLQYWNNLFVKQREHKFA